MIKLLLNLKPFTPIIVLILIFISGQAMAELALPTLMSDVVNNGMMMGDTGYILRYGAYMLLVALLSSGCSIIGSFFSARVAIGLGRNLRNMVFTRVENYSLHEFDKLGTASLITRTTNDIVQIQTVLVMMLRFMINLEFVREEHLRMVEEKLQQTVDLAKSSNIGLVELTEILNLLYKNE